MNFNAITSQQDIEDTYLAPFQAAVQRGAVSGLMCSYNSVNGVPSCANEWSMNEVARESWNFDGYITSDCGAVASVTEAAPTSHPWGKRTHGGHGFELKNGSLASAGLDNNCNLGGGTIGGTPAAQDGALEHLFSVQFRLGVFDELATANNPFSLLDEASVGSTEHQRLALEAAQQGQVLLQNEGNALPLQRSMSVALVGPCLEVRNGGYSKGGSNGKFTGAAGDAISSRAKHTVVAPGCASVGCAKTADGFQKAAAAAASADRALVFVGIDSSMEGENGDFRAFNGIGLPGAQAELVESVAAASKSPIIVVVTGSSVDLGPIKSNPKVGAILWAGYSGEAAGESLASILFGEVNPSGRLTSTFYPQTFSSNWKGGVDPYVAGASSSPENASYFDCFMRPNVSSGNPGRSHRFYTGKASFVFGDGISYSQVMYSQPTLEFVPGGSSGSGGRSVALSKVEQYAQVATMRNNFLRDGELVDTVAKVSLTVANVGGMKGGAHSVLAYMVPPSHANVPPGAPLQTLIGYEKVWLTRLSDSSVLAAEAGTAVSFGVTLHDLTLTAEEGGRVAVPGSWVVVVGNTKTELIVK